MKTYSPRLCLAKDIEVSLGGRTILHSVNLEIERGPVFAIVGESGSGKTTLLSALTGLLIPEKGSIQFGGRELATMHNPERASTFGLVFQDYQLFPHLTALQNLVLAPRLRGLNLTEKSALALLAELGVESLAERFPNEMSGGQKQRVAIARSLFLEPEILFLDEPSAALDEKSTFELADLLKKLNNKSQIVTVSHDRPFLNRFAERGIRLEKGKIIARGSLQELFLP